MNQRLIVIWAVGASVVALSALSYIAGKRAGTVSSSVSVANPTEGPYTGPGGEARAPMPAYEIPASLDRMPTQWRTATNASAQGYVAVFDPQRRDLLVEQCAHPGYSVEKASSGQFDPPFCERVLRVQLHQLTETTAAGIERSGNSVQVIIDATLDSSPPSFRLTFGDHDATFTPGSKNDYFQELEALPAIAAQKDEYMQKLMKQSQSQPKGTQRQAPSAATND